MNRGITKKDKKIERDIERARKTGVMKALGKTSYNNNSESGRTKKRPGRG